MSEQKILISPCDTCDPEIRAICEKPPEGYFCQKVNGKKDCGAYKDFIAAAEKKEG